MALRGPHFQYAVIDEAYIMSDREVARVSAFLASDERLSAPLWDWPPEARPYVLSQRRRRGILQGDPEPSGDPEYS